MRQLARALAARALEGGGRLLEAVGEGVADATRVTRFVRGLLELEARPDDVFIVTYPRSGTTWMQFLLHLLKTGGRDDFEHISDVAPWFERSLALGTRTAADFDAMPSPRLFKSHLHPSWIPRGARSVYIVRDVEDVAVSYYHLYRSHLRYRGSFDEFIERFLRGDVQYKSWFKHVAAWRAHAERAPVLILEYERLLADLPSCVDELVAFTGFGVEPDRLPSILEKASFAFMKAHEDRFDHATEQLRTSGMKARAFLRNGKRGEGRARLSAEQRAAISRLAARPPRLARVELDLAPYLH